VPRRQSVSRNDAPASWVLRSDEPRRSAPERSARRRSLLSKSTQ
jgi:hypothetical protein